MNELQGAATSPGPAIATVDGLATNDPGGRTDSNSDLAPAADDSTDAAEIPTQQGPKGLRFDFNDGCRVTLPMSDHPWQVKISDLDTGNVVYQTEIRPAASTAISDISFGSDWKSPSRVKSCYVTTTPLPTARC